MDAHHYFDHDADIGLIGQGSTLEFCFIDAAQALFSLMTDLSQVQPEVCTQFEFEEADIELAFVTWLNLLIAKAQADHLVFSRFQLVRSNHHWQCTAQGQNWKAEFERRIEVKGATLTMLSVKEMAGKWEARCVLDV